MLIPTQKVDSSDDEEEDKSSSIENGAKKRKVSSFTISPPNITDPVLPNISSQTLALFDKPQRKGSQRSASKKKVVLPEIKICITCRTKLSGANLKTACQKCATCCDSDECRSERHKQQRQLKASLAVAASRNLGPDVTEDEFWNAAGIPYFVQKCLPHASSEQKQEVEDFVQRQSQRETEKKEVDKDKAQVESLVQGLMRVCCGLVARIEALESAVAKSEADIKDLTKKAHTMQSQSEQMQKQIKERNRTQEMKEDKHDKIEEIVKKLEELNRKQNTQCDTPFRCMFKKIVEKEFGVQEFGEQKVTIVSRRNLKIVLASKIQGVVYGDGGPYIECNEEDINKAAFPHKEMRSFFDLWYTNDRDVKAYHQKRNVEGQKNPPKDAKYRDAQNRVGGMPNTSPERCISRLTRSPYTRERGISLGKTSPSVNFCLRTLRSYQ
jgi:hypothetical protein